MVAGQVGQEEAEEQRHLFMTAGHLGIVRLWDSRSASFYPAFFPAAAAITALQWSQALPLLLSSASCFLPAVAALLLLSRHCSGDRMHSRQQVCSMADLQAPVTSHACMSVHTPVHIWRPSAPSLMLTGPPSLSLLPLFSFPHPTLCPFPLTPSPFCSHSPSLSPEALRFRSAKTCSWVYNLGLAPGKSYSL